jgi:hypothetical protein
MIRKVECISSRKSDEFIPRDKIIVSAFYALAEIIPKRVQLRSTLFPAADIASVSFHSLVGPEIYKLFGILPCIA